MRSRTPHVVSRCPACKAITAAYRTPLEEAASISDALEKAWQQTEAAIERSQVRLVACECQKEEI